MKDKDNFLQNAGINTRLSHMGNSPFDFHGFVNPPVVHASTVLFPNARMTRNTHTGRAELRRPMRFARR
jgi:cystathionine beta-lyase